MCEVFDCSGFGVFGAGDDWSFVSVALDLLEGSGSVSDFGSGLVSDGGSDLVSGDCSDLVSGLAGFGFDSFCAPTSSFARSCPTVTVLSASANSSVRTPDCGAFTATSI